MEMSWRRPRRAWSLCRGAASLACTNQWLSPPVTCFSAVSLRQSKRGEPGMMITNPFPLAERTGLRCHSRLGEGEPTPQVPPLHYPAVYAALLRGASVFPGEIARDFQEGVRLGKPLLGRRSGMVPAFDLLGARSSSGGTRP